MKQLSPLSLLVTKSEGQKHSSVQGNSDQASYNSFDASLPSFNLFSMEGQNASVDSLYARCPQSAPNGLPLVR